ncbi:MAG TPA: hypothetical protein VK533_15855 [Sphingomonas sp.]|uniref:hypothetical protein n=1 Tax=Sphingomonas sp. TaxID=28214 RepID=UPI002BEE4D63|nr:hypothetical protein [Sphingomonas sp.]HMI21008.1 hypothetical protein [Sphingomonas sp.]
MQRLLAGGLTLSLGLAGCAQQPPALPTNPIDLAATCGVVAAASEREAAGAKGDLSADAQARILHYAMLYASTGDTFDPDKINIVSKRMPVLFDGTIKGKWQTLRTSCATAFPAAQIKQPVLPAKPVDAMLQCYVLTDFLRKALADQGANYGAAANAYGAFKDQLDTKMTPVLRAAGLHNGDTLKQKRMDELAAATKLGQPPAVIDACEKKYGA